MFIKQFYSVRAWRCVRFNKKYAEKLERKAARKKEQEKKVEELVPSTGQKSNPFSVSSYPEVDRHALIHDLS